MMIRGVSSAVLLLAVATATPLWLRPERPLDSHLSTDPRALADYLLPTALIPSQYEVHLIPYLDTDAPTPEQQFTFDGVVKIRITCSDATNVIKMHAYDITIASKDDIKVTLADSATVVPVDSFEISDDDKNFFTIQLGQSLEVAAEYDVEITYTGKLNEDLDGFYRSSYVEEGVTKYMAVTQFESTGARRAFPCFDEPGLKAMFKIKIARSPGHTILGNMPVQIDTEDVPGLTGWKWVEFENSVQMSSYLVAFSVNLFDKLDGAVEDGITYKVWARPNAVSTGAYANQMAPQVVQFMKGYTGHAYALPKIDQIAVPDFAAGAMENWGLITYRETALLYDEEKASETNKQRVGAVVAHELAHQWFGNLVSPEWWGNLWLNEGFATYFEYHATNNVETTWKMDEQFIYEQLHTVLDSDALESTHPIIADVDSPSTIDSVFDDISYNKGGCMVRFMVDLLGEDTFKTGINKYLEDNKFDNANADSLWAAMETVVPADLLPTGVTFKNLMDTWTLQGGYPVISFERLYDDKQRAIVTQERFLSTPSETPFEEQWIVPLTMTGKDTRDFNDLSIDAWLTAPNMVLENVANNEDWVIVNLQQMGYYRVNYDEENWRLLARAINGSDSLNNIHVINRAQLMNDALALARAKYVSYPIALDTTNYLNFETEYLPWATAFSSLSYINDRLNSEEGSKILFEKYLLSRLMETYNRLGGFTIPVDEGHVSSLTRSMVLNWACQLGYKNCNDDAAAKFDEWRAKPNPDVDNPTNPNLKSVVYCSGMRVGDKEDWDFLFARYEAAFETATEQALILTALGCSADAEILKDYLALSIAENSPIRSQDTRSVLSSVYNNPVGVDIALDFLIEEFATLQQQMGGFSSIGRVFSGIAGKLNTPEQRQKLQAFYDENETNLGGAAPAVSGAIATVDENIKWHDDHKETVVAYLKAKSSAGFAIMSPLLLLVASIVTKLFN